jgi:hypothetical protein
MRLWTCAVVVRRLEEVNETAATGGTRAAAQLAKGNATMAAITADTRALLIGAALM